MKKTLYFILFLGLTFSLMSCTNSGEKYDIVTTMYTQYTLTKDIVKDKMSVDMLVPLGQDIHSFEASSQDMVTIENSKIFMYTSSEIDTWINNPETIGGDQTIVLNMESFIHSDHTVSQTTLLSDEHEHEHEHENIHYWVDPNNAILMAEVIRDTLIEIDPDNQTFYSTNTSSLIQNIRNESELISNYVTGLSYNPTIYFAGHNALELFGDYFGIEIISIFDEFKPDADLTSSELLTFVNQIIDTNTHYLFIEALEEPRAANAIKNELLTSRNYELTLLELHSYHNVTQEDFDNNITYTDLMDRNFKNIQQTLGE